MALVECPDCHRHISDGATSCIGCGRPMISGSPTELSKSAGTPPTTRGAEFHLACPKCGSEQTAKVSIVYASGRSQIGLATIGKQFGRRGGSFVSASGGRTESELAASLAPPVRREEGGGVIGFVVVAVIVAIVAIATSSWLVAVIGLGLVALALLGREASQKYNATHYRPLMAEWERKYLCQRCDTTFLYPPTAAA